MKKLFVLSLTVILSAGFANGSGDSAKKDDKLKPISLIFTSVSVTGDSHIVAMKAFADKVKELSNGSVTGSMF